MLLRVPSEIVLNREARIWPILASPFGAGLPVVGIPVVVVPVIVVVVPVRRGLIAVIRKLAVQPDAERGAGLQSDVGRLVPLQLIVEIARARAEQRVEQRVALGERADHE